MSSWSLKKQRRFVWQCPANTMEITKLCSRLQFHVWFELLWEMPKFQKRTFTKMPKLILIVPFWASITQLLRMSHDRLRNQPWSKPKIRYMLVWKNIARGQIHVDRICEYLNVWSVTWRLRHALLMAFSTSSSLSLETPKIAAQKVKK